MTIEADHTIDLDTFPPTPAVITLTIGDAEHELTPTQAREVIEALTRELDAIKRHQAHVHFTANPTATARMTRSEWIEAGRQHQRDAVAAQEAADAAERTRQAQEVADRRSAAYAARQAESRARWQARARRVAQANQEAQK